MDGSSGLHLSCKVFRDLSIINIWGNKSYLLDENVFAAFLKHYLSVFFVFFGFSLQVWLRTNDLAF